MPDNLKRAGTFRKFVYFFMVSVLDFHCWALKNQPRDDKKFPARFLPANCAEISKVTSGGGNWILRDLGPPEAKAFDRKHSLVFVYEIRLWKTDFAII